MEDNNQDRLFLSRSLFLSLPSISLPFSSLHSICSNCHNCPALIWVLDKYRENSKNRESEKERECLGEILESFLLIWIRLNQALYIDYNSN